MKEIRAVLDALQAKHDAEVNERAAQDLMTSALMYRTGVAEAVDVLRRATAAREDAYWDALNAARAFGDTIPEPVE